MTPVQIEISFLLKVIGHDSVENNICFTKCCCQNVELQKNIITVIIHTSIHTSVVKVNYHSDILYFTNAGVKMSSRSIITLIVSWPGWRHERRHEEVNCMTRRRQGGQHPLISFMPLCQVLPRATTFNVKLRNSSIMETLKNELKHFTFSIFLERFLMAAKGIPLQYQLAGECG